jgi:quinoprotein glucose dehydrogenase
MRTVKAFGLFIVIGLVLAAPPVAGQRGTTGGEWRYYGGDSGSTRYSPLDQINRDNVKDLQIVWRWKAQNFGAQPEFNLQATPLMIGGVLYTTAGTRRDVVAIDAATGETLWMWRYDEGKRGQMAPRHNHRGVAYWTDGRGDERIVYITPGYHLIALNAKTGQPIPAFGKNGIVDLYEGLDRPAPNDGLIGASSPPIINQSGIPMTYMVNGRQYMIVAVGAQGVPAEFVALAVP